jgi:molybdopterin-guanine dinucleotide biosynthesis protein B
MTAHRVFGIAGFKNAGKTTLVVDLVRELSGRGFAVATVKHAHHDFDVDHPGKDSHRHREAGAREVLVASSRRFAHIRELRDEPEPALAELLRHLGPVDLVLVEGFKGGDHPKLEVRRQAQPGPPLLGQVPNVVAVATDDPSLELPVGVTRLPREDVPAIADFILAQVNLPRQPG